ncbi:GlsB/YeaQ/YmgE family stress response membrane protein [Aliishimia ponticola]|uniref:GlsB/YeaQ/YmgE family stress response membrane protein n=1 Tax=Aliishimia ponticola TaxID=2499833 RepID=A0A4S4N7E6_9RHOB|nr:GlsB/YeaQ/YmgE family stress response membrane protein [Aliishimia ponticola]THH35064.1 GlsB/YeaQ/YmgE family stress response membrane protein [Aliishimia ponticola]
MFVIWLLIIGAAAGFLATRIMRVQLDVITTVVIGMVGALIGGLLLRLAAGVFGLLGGLVGAVLGAMLVLWLWQQMQKK